MDINILRRNGQNIENIDDYLVFKYAYGNKDGHTKGLSYDVRGNIFHIGAGRIVIQGVESDIETGGIDLELDIIAEKRFVVVYASTNMSTKTTSILTTYFKEEVNEWTNLKYDDIVTTGQGIAQLPMFTMWIENGVITDVRKKIKQIPFAEEIKVQKAMHSDTSTNAVNVSGTIIDGTKATTQATSDYSRNVATTEFVKNVFRENTLKIVAQPNSQYYDVDYVAGYDQYTHFAFTISATNDGVTTKKITKEIPKTSLIVNNSSDLGVETGWVYAYIRIFNGEFQVNVSASMAAEYKIVEIFARKEV